MKELCLFRSLMEITTYYNDLISTQLFFQ